MSSHNQVLDLSARHQLIDLNKDKINFKVSFHVVSDPIGQEFQAIVMNQNDLNNYSKLDDIQMKTAPGKIGGTIVFHLVSCVSLEQIAEAIVFT